MPRPPTSSALAILCGVAISSALSEPELIFPEARAVRFKGGADKMIFSGATLAPAYSSSSPAPWDFQQLGLQASTLD